MRISALLGAPAPALRCSLPEGLFTETNEKFHGRVAMLGLGLLLAIEVLTGHALL